jgi:biopolymer transport protein ExbD
VTKTNLAGELDTQRWLAARKEKRRTPKEARMDMTPMIDVVFLLIIFFMVVTELVRLEIEPVTLPWALNAREDHPPPNRVVVNIKSDPDGIENGSIWVNRSRYEPPALKALLRRAVLASGADTEGLAEMQVKIRGDANVEWKFVQNVMSACSRARIWQVAFGANPVDDLQF